MVMRTRARGERPSTPAPSLDGRSLSEPPLRRRIRNLSPTRRPQIRADAALWSTWSLPSIEVFELDRFDDVLTVEDATS